MSERERTGYRVRPCPCGSTHPPEPSHPNAPGWPWVRCPECERVERVDLPRE